MGIKNDNDFKRIISIGKGLFTTAIGFLLLMGCNKKDGIPGGGGVPFPKVLILTIMAERSIVDYGDSVKILWHVNPSNLDSLIVTINGQTFSNQYSGHFYARLLTSTTTFSGFASARGYPTVTNSVTITVNPQSPTAAKITAGDWKYTKIEVRQVGTVTWNELILLPCTQDDRHVYTIDKRYLWIRNSVPCNPGENNFQGQWKLIDNDARIIRGDTLMIMGLTDANMILQQLAPDITTGQIFEMRHTYSRW